MSDVKSYVEEGKQIGQLVEEKQAAYGDAFSKAGEILRVLYPNGIKPHQMTDALCVTRIIDKLFRIANNQYETEEPYRDIAGYGLLGHVRSKRK